MRAVLLAVLGLALAADQAHPCARPQLTDKAITADGAVIPSGGGVVITTVNGFGGDDGFDGSGGGQLMAGTDNVEQSRVYLAPALTVIVAKPQANRTIELVSPRGKKLLSLTQGDLAPKHAAPRLAKVHSTLVPAKPDLQQRWAPTSQYTIELGQAPPDDVLALIVHVRGSGIAWARPQKGQTTYTFYAGGKRCSPGPAPLAQGTTVTVAWLDAGGRLSVESRAVKVGATPKSKP